MNKKVFRPAKSKEYLTMGKIATIFVLGLFLIFAGCGGEAPKPTKVPIPAAGPRLAAQAPAKEPSPATIEVQTVGPPPFVSFTYNPQGKPNPFQPLVVEKPELPAPPKKRVEQAGKKEESEPGTPLEKIDLDAFKLVAVVWGIPNPRAMVEEAGGRGYILTVGTRIGKNKGQIAKISATGVVVNEKFEDSDGKVKTREVPLRLYAD